MADRQPGGALTVRRVDMADAREAAALVALRRAWVEERRGGPVDDPGFEATLRAWLWEGAPPRLTSVGRRCEGADVGARRVEAQRAGPVEFPLGPAGCPRPRVAGELDPAS